MVHIRYCRQLYNVYQYTFIYTYIVYVYILHTCIYQISYVMVMLYHEYFICKESFKILKILYIVVRNLMMCGLSTEHS